MTRAAGLWRRPLLTGALGALLAACGGAAAAQSAQAVEVCRAKQSEVALRWGAVSQVVGAYSVTAGEVADWQETRHRASGIRRTSHWRSVFSGLPVHVCYYDGDFDGFPGKGQRPPYDRLAVIIGADGAISLDAAGPRSVFPIERPTRK